MGRGQDDEPVSPPGPEGLPFIGSTRDLAHDRLGFLTRTAHEYGDVANMRFAGRKFVLLSHPDHIRYVLVENNQNYTKGHFFQDRIEFLGNGLLNSEGEEWRRQRHLIEPAFHPTRIAGYAGLMTTYTERLIDSWEDGEIRNIHTDMMRLTLEIVAKALFDVDIRNDEGEISQALSTVMEHFRLATSRLVNTPNWVPTHGNIQYLRAARALDRIVEEIIEERRQNGDAGDVVSMLLRTTDEHGETMSPEGIHDQVMTLIIAGHETTAQALTFTWYLLSRYPRIEEQLLAELDTVLGDRQPTLEDVDDLAFTEKVVRESMRLYPPIYGIVREPIEDDVIGGYQIQAGETIQMLQWIVHRDPRFYDDPQAFHPARWTDEFRKNLHPFAYFPFSGGPRRCIGDRFAMLEVRLIVATLLQQIHLAATTDELELAPALTLRPKNGLEMRVERR